MIGAQKLSKELKSNAKADDSNLNLHLPSFFGGGNFRVTSFEFELDKLEPINKRSKHLFDSFIIDIASDG